MAVLSIAVFDMIDVIRMMLTALPMRFVLLPLMRWLAVSRHPIKGFVAFATTMAFAIEGIRWIIVQ
ncbi:MAG: hypothetical protein BECKG1743D_GA0114223_106144 [Candidatus Kentron sp. G]|nr:MAG: hypothetical protein BECKG1743F_GA0114225_104324 [Candidatus Kentron sp. G]VFN01789.1 MAG: hypothetical protein BECKG1743E_GA0114224_104434 [Candidatus Kentron sp. G]VFN04653.1 MAG: hypothetical protein BECKG1743D_GA0114223_106144 [Candidatus Kentron sp. G]